MKKQGKYGEILYFVQFSDEQILWINENYIPEKLIKEFKEDEFLDISIENVKEKQRIKLQNIIKEKQNKIFQLQESLNKETCISQSNSQISQLKSTIENLKTIGKILLNETTLHCESLNRFTNYDANLISLSNNRKISYFSNILESLNDGNSNIIDWDGKSSGSISFDFSSNYQMNATSIVNGDGNWYIEYSDNNSNFTKCAEINLNSYKAIGWNSVGSHRYWRWSLQGAHGNPFFSGWKWFYS